MELLLVALMFINVCNFIIQTQISRQVKELHDKLKKTNEVHTMALSKIIQILDSHTATIEDTSANSDVIVKTTHQLESAVTSLLKNAAVQTKAQKQLLDNTK